MVAAKDEEKCIARTLQSVRDQRYPVELIVVSNGSTDRTAFVASKINGIKLIRHVKNSGKGAAIRTGLKHAAGDIILIQDADLEYNPAEIVKVVNPIVERKADVVYGSRYLDPVQKARNKRFLKKAHKNAYQLFYIGGRGLTLVANLLYKAKITDEATCYKAFRSNVIKGIRLRCTRFEFCPEVTAKVAKRGIRIAEVPITYNPRSFEEGKKIKMRDGIEALWALLKYRFFD